MMGYDGMRGDMWGCGDDWMCLVWGYVRCVDMIGRFGMGI